MCNFLPSKDDGKRVKPGPRHVGHGGDMVLYIFCEYLTSFCMQWWKGDACFFHTVGEGFFIYFLGVAKTLIQYEIPRIWFRIFFANIFARSVGNGGIETCVFFARLLKDFIYIVGRTLFAIRRWDMFFLQCIATLSGCIFYLVLVRMVLHCMPYCIIVIMVCIMYGSLC